VSKAQFDKSFGEHFLETLPQTPGVYLFMDREGELLYVGKAKDLRQRLRCYRNASRRKVHRKMRLLVREARAIEVRQVETEQEALLLENELIRSRRPLYNVDGAFSFLYPAIGLLRRRGHTILCFTLNPDLWAERDLRLYGSFRSRLRTKEAFDALSDLLLRLGHKEPWSKLPELPRDRGSRIIGVRRLDAELLDALEAYLAGESRRAVELLALRLLEQPSARHEASLVQEELRQVASFFETDIRELFEVRQRVGWRSSFVPQADRDALFIRATGPCVR
jgi:excinuclease ABC subunit C